MPKKFKHEDGTETILKVKHYKYDEITLKRKEVKKDFVTLFVSVSNGCKIGCKLCFLTYSSNSNYKLLTPENIINNNKNICSNINYNNIKVSFMGMGEGVFLHKELQSIADSIADDKLCAVDIGTMLPFISKDLKDSLNNLKNGRIFFSLHSAVQNSRDKLITSKVSLEQAKEFLGDLNIKKVCHYTLVKGVNDSDEEIRSAIKYCSDINAQLRILEFNKIGNLEPTDRKNRVVELLRNESQNYKLCYSSGKSIKAACGMFF
jgi:adenine C2-methylase RlmN of 23S rRNA A2503 and tRNA A37